METELKNFLDSLVKRGIPGCDCAIRHNRRPVFRHMAGYADSAGKKPVTDGQIYWIYSVTKLFTCTAVMQLIEKGSIGLDDPVCDYLPDYRNLTVKHGSSIKRAENTMTIRHLLSMQSGLNYNLNAPSIQRALQETDGQATTSQVVEALAEEPLDFEPGTHYQYSLSHDVLGAVIEVVTGRRFGKYLDDKIFRPLGMKHTGFTLTPNRKAKLADQFRYDTQQKISTRIPPSNHFVLSRRYESGGAGLISTVDDMMLFLDALCNGGTSKDGYRLLAPESIDRMRTDQLNDISRKDFARFGKIGYGYGLGVRTLVDKEKSGSESPLGEFGWGGAAGAYALVDPENHLAIYYAQHVLGCEFVCREVQPRIRDLAYRMLA